MKMMTKEIEKRIPGMGETEEIGKDARVHVKFFSPYTGWTWYATEYDPVDRIFFGLVDGHEKELGYFSLDDLESVRGPLGLPIERDLHWNGTVTLSEIRGAA